MDKREQQNNDFSSVSDLTPQSPRAKQSVQQTLSEKEAETRANSHTSPNTGNAENSDPMI